MGKEIWSKFATQTQVADVNNLKVHRLLNCLHLQMGSLFLSPFPPWLPLHTLAVRISASTVHPPCPSLTCGSGQRAAAWVITWGGEWMHRLNSGVLDEGWHAAQSSTLERGVNWGRPTPRYSEWLFLARGHPSVIWKALQVILTSRQGG